MHTYIVCVYTLYILCINYVCTTYIYICIYRYICIHCMYILYIYIYTYVNIYMYTYIYSHIHTLYIWYIYIYMYMLYIHYISTIHHVKIHCMYMCICALHIILDIHYIVYSILYLLYRIYYIVYSILYWYILYNHFPNLFARLFSSGWTLFHLWVIRISIWQATQRFIVYSSSSTSSRLEPNVWLHLQTGLDISMAIPGTHGSGNLPPKYGLKYGT